MSDILNMTAIVLAGMKQSRPGWDGAFRKFGASTTLEHLANMLQNIFSETIVIVDKKDRVASLNLGEAQVREQILPGPGALSGIYTGLAASKCGAACVLTCDTPFIDEEMLRELASLWDGSYDALCLEDEEGKLEPFPGIFSRQSRQLVRMMLERDRGSVRLFLRVAALKVVEIETRTIQVTAGTQLIQDRYQALKEKEEWVP